MFQCALKIRRKKLKASHALKDRKVAQPLRMLTFYIVHGRF